MSSFFSYIVQKKIPNKETVIAELKRPTPVTIFFFCILVLFFAILYTLVWRISESQTVVKPVHGGTLIEGVIGAPRFINPLLAASATDAELSVLTYGGLVSFDGNGNIIPNLATYTQTPDGKNYTFTLEPEIKFSDGSPVTADDILFTINLIKKGVGSTQLQAEWKNAVVAAPDIHTITITLDKPQTNFLAAATVGILPKKYWVDTPPEQFADSPYILSPIGAGPFTIHSISYQNGIPREVTLVPNKYAIIKPYIGTYQMIIYPNQEQLLGAVSAGSVDMTADLTSDTIGAQEFLDYVTTELDTDDSVALYASSADTILNDPRLLSFITHTIDKQALLDTIENSYGHIDDPQLSLPSTLPAINTIDQLLAVKDFTRGADGILRKQGTPVRLSLSVESNSKEAVVAEAIAATLSNNGISTEVKSFDTGTFRDLLEHGTLSAAVLSTAKQTIPATLSLRVPLYTRTAPIIINTNIKDVLKESSAHTLTTLYPTAAHWYTTTQRLWKWF